MVDEYTNMHAHTEVSSSKATPVWLEVPELLLRREPLISGDMRWTQSRSDRKLY